METEQRGWITQAHPSIGFIFRLGPQRGLRGKCIRVEVWVYEIVTFAREDQTPANPADYNVGGIKSREPGVELFDTLIAGDQITDENADWVMKGAIKWDGCSTMYFPDGVHICGIEDARNWGKMLERLWKECLKLCGEEVDGDA